VLQAAMETAKYKQHIAGAKEDAAGSCGTSVKHHILKPVSEPGYFVAS
jgi:hypothetical protein